MATCNNPKDLKDNILRRLGAPVINVEVTEEQIYDCIGRAMELYGEFHFEALNKSYMAIKLTEDQAKSGLVVLENPQSVFAVTKVIRSSSGLCSSFGGTPYAWFQSMVNGLSGGGQCNTFSPMGGGGIGMYVGFSSYFNLLQDILQPLPDYWYNSVNGQLQFFGNFEEDDVIMVEVYVKSFVELDLSRAVAGRGMIAGSAGCDTMVDDEIIYNNPYAEMTSKFRAGCSSEFMDQNVYNVRWIKDYSTSLVKQLNGYILAKHQGMQLPGGVTVDGIRLIEEANEELANLREELELLEGPLPILMG
jgi:hypothetical protein